ncbi:MAG: DUF2442 domain-containing protein [Chloroflexi bacterium]|nr:MAG: DUF2442 domain-containing protein [Chloroflexota bacterium]
MNHPVYRVVNVEITAPYTLHVIFNDGTEQVINLRPVLEGPLYGPLQDEALFNQVEIDPEVHTVVWPNGADFDPETLYHWPRYKEKMAQMAKQWAALKLR